MMANFISTVDILDFVHLGGYLSKQTVGGLYDILILSRSLRSDFCRYGSIEVDGGD
jgi:hypothetical protein